MRQDWKTHKRRFKLKYTVTMSEDQLRIMREALEFYSRFLAGQMGAFPQAFQNILWGKELNNFSPEVLGPISYLKKVIFDFEPSESYGIHSNEVCKEAKIAYDMYYMIYHKFVKDSMSAYKHPPLKTSDEDLINIEYFRKIQEEGDRSVQE
jgi:hypothetical protein